jgi:TolA-binding protein
MESLLFNLFEGYDMPSRWITSFLLTTITTLAMIALAASPSGIVDAADKDKKNNNDAVIDKLRNQLQNAERELNERQATINKLRNQVETLERRLNLEKKDDILDMQAAKRQISQLQENVKSLQGELKERDATIAKLKKGDKPSPPPIGSQAPYVHVVLFYLKGENPTKEIDAIITDSSRVLSKIKTVRAIWAGPPSDKAAPIATKDYHVALVVTFDDYNGLKAYLDDPAHKQFAEKHNKNAQKIVVYDFLKQ